MSWTQWGASADYFGGADYDALRSQGKSNKEILDYLNSNYGVLREQNVPGGGGIYDQISRAHMDDVRSDYEKRLANQQQQFQNSLSDYQRQFESRFNQQQSGYQSQLNSLNSQLSDVNSQLGAFKNSYNQTSDVSRNTATVTNAGDSMGDFGMSKKRRPMGVTNVGNKNQLKINSITL